jgi:hypothetical protein
LEPREERELVREDFTPERVIGILQEAELLRNQGPQDRQDLAVPRNLRAELLPVVANSQWTEGWPDKTPEGT